MSSLIFNKGVETMTNGMLVVADGKMEKNFKITITSGHYDALMIILSEICPYSDDRNLGYVLQEMIDDYLLNRKGDLGRVVNGNWEQGTRNAHRIERVEGSVNEYCICGIAKENHSFIDDHNFTTIYEENKK